MGGVMRAADPGQAMRALLATVAGSKASDRGEWRVANGE
jgi:hypothetical protein